MLLKPATIKIPHLALRNGELIPNPQGTGIVPFFLKPSTFPLVLAASTGQDITVFNDNSGMFEIIAMVFTATSSDFTVRIVDEDSSRQYMKNPVIAGTILGTAAIPYYLPCPLYILPGSNVTFSLFNNTLVPNTIRIMLYGKKYKQPERVFGDNYRTDLKQRKPYWYTTDQALSIVIGATVENQFTITQESDFYLRKINVVSTGTYDILITREKTGETLMNGAIPSTLFASDGQSFLEFDQEIFIENRTQLTVQVANTSGALNRVFLTFAGTNYYYDRSRDECR
jgi:hypothetical protein